MNDDERALIQRAESGDQHALGVLITRHYEQILRVALRVLDDYRDAEEVTQDVLVQLWTGLDAFDRRSSLTTWLHRVAVNRSRSRLRTRRRHEPLPDQSHRLHPRAQHVNEQAEDRAELRAAISTIIALPEELRTVFVLCQLERRSYRDVAAIVHGSEATVRGRLARARTRLARATGRWH